MESENRLLEKIVEVEGDCFSVRTPCSDCPFKSKCFRRIINDGVFIPTEVRLEWALQELFERTMFDDTNQTRSQTSSE